MVSLERNLYGHPLAGLRWERQLEQALSALGLEKIPNWDNMFVHRKQVLFLSVFVDDIKMDDIKMAGKQQNLAPMLKILMKSVEVDELTSFLTTCIWDALSGKANRMKQSLNNAQKCSNHVFLLEQQRKLPGWQKPHAQTGAWSYDMEGHAQKCVERYCDLANKKVEQLHKVSHPCLDDHQFKFAHKMS